ncbi:hypothetical protein JCM8097_007579 [Rhodosporidiobolus ruineniae]
MPRRSFGNRRRRDDDDEEEEMDADQLAAQPDELPKPPGIEPFGPSPPFGLLVSLYQEFESATRNKHKKPGYKAEALRNFFITWRKIVGPDLYPLVRLLMPDRDTRRGTYKLKEAKLAKAIITALDLPHKSDASVKLLNWKLPTKEDPGAGEFATVAYEVITTRSSVITSKQEVTIDVVNQLLDELSHMKGNTFGPDGKKKSIGVEHARLLKSCVQKMTPTEMKWFIRIILRDLKIGMGEKTILNQLHPDAVDVFNTCSDIKRVCWRLFNPNERIMREDCTITIGRVFRPMLAWRSNNFNDVIKAMKRGRPRRDPDYQWRDGEYRDDEFMIEEKLDGERIQLHKIGDEYQYHSRKAKDYTYLYGKDYEEGSLTPFLQDALIDGIEEVILDGEMLVWDPSMNKYMAFGNLKTFALQKKAHFGPNDARPCFKVFDILYIKGKDKPAQPLLEKALWDRKQLLGRILKQKKGVIEIAECATGKTADDIRNYLTRILEERGEGLVIKHPLSHYSLGTREDAWIKIKPDYMDSLGETVDGVVIGGYWGQGGRKGILASYMIGLRGKVNGKDVVFSFAKVGSGINAEGYQWIKQNFQHKFFNYERQNKPDWFQTVSEWPDMLINPEDSFVLEVKAAEVTVGAEYGAGMTLRFPRTARWRSDKDWDDSADLETVRALQSGPQKRTLDGDLAQKRTSTRTNVSKKARSVATALGKVEVNADIFKGLVFYVHQGPMKSEIEKKIVANGGQIIQTIPPAEVDRLVVAAEFKGTLPRKKGIADVDVVKPDWVNESIEKGRRMPLVKRLLAKATDETMSKPEYSLEAEDNGDETTLKADSDVEEPMPPAQSSRTPSASPPPHLQYREMIAKHGEVALDSEDEPETEEEEEKDDWEEVDAREADEEEWEELAASQATVTNGVGELALSQAEGGSSAEASQGTVTNGVGELGLSQTEDDSFVEASEAEDTQATEVQEIRDEDMGVEEIKAEETGVKADEEDDPDRPFKRFVAYFDTRSNAVDNDLKASVASDGVQKQADKLLLSAKTAFIDGGGVATDDLLDPKLTHLVVTNLVQDRYKDLINLTSQPKYRRIVTVDWISDSLEEGTAVDEADYKP